MTTGRRRSMGGQLAAALGLGLSASLVWLLLVGVPAARPADPPDAPVVVLTDPTPPPPRSTLTGIVALSATATPITGRTITSVQFESSPAASDAWTVISTDTAAPYTAAWSADLEGPNDLRAVATDSAGVIGTSTLFDLIVQPDPAKQATLRDPGPNLRGSVTLTSTIAASPGTTIVDASYERHLSAGPRTWEPIGTSNVPAGSFPLIFDTTTVADGVYDFRVVAHDDIPSDIYSRTVLRRRIDNTPPTAALTSPGATLTGRVALNADAADGDGSGVATVRYERAIAGTGAWTLIATDRIAPYQVNIQTAGIPNGSYDLRVVAIDRAGNSTPSVVVPGVQIDNPPQPRVTVPSIQSMAVPVRNPTILGSIANSPQDETWAFGFTSAVPAQVDGQRLPYTAPGAQLVLLRFTTDTGWQIRDVLREPGGGPFPLPVTGPGARTVVGAMAPSGEGWIAVSFTPPNGPPTSGIFHRQPGGSFVLDSASATVLGDLIGPKMSLRVKSQGQAVFGALANAVDQASGTPLALPGPTGASVSVARKLAIGLLGQGTWTRIVVDPPAGYVPRPGNRLEAEGSDVDSPGSAWAVVTVKDGSTPRPMFLTHRTAGGQWVSASTGIDALDLPDGFGSPAANVSSARIFADTTGPWIEASSSPAATAGKVVARFDPSGKVLQAWCATILESDGCTDVLDVESPAVLPEAVFSGPAGPIALASGIRRFENGSWASLPAFGSGIFTGPTEGWLASDWAVGRWTISPQPGPLVNWPQANRNPLLAVAMPPGNDASLGSSGALAVGIAGTALHYDAAVGWQVDPVPNRAARTNLFGVAFSGPNTAVAVGQAGTILRWNGSEWSLDPQSAVLSENQLNAVAFARSGQGWAVGRFGTILHFDGTTWNMEQPPVEDNGINISSVAVAGDEVFALIGGSLITRGADGTWRRVGPEMLPDPPPRAGDLRLLSGLPDGGLVAAGRAIVLQREGPSGRLEPSAQPVENIVVAVAATRDAAGRLRPLVSVASPVALVNENTGTLERVDIGGLPAGDGELLRQLPDGTWKDLSLQQDPAAGGGTEGQVNGDPVLAIAASPDGARAWAVGGYTGTVTAGGLGTTTVLAARPVGWRTSSIWRFDADGQKPAPGLQTATVSIPAQPGTVSFAFFSGSMCAVRCSSALQAQPDVNLRAAAAQIAAFAQQPGGPSFAVAGGNLRGPFDSQNWLAGNGSGEFARLPDLLAQLGQLPLFAAFGPRDPVSRQDHPSGQWADVFATNPAPFGSGPAVAALVPAGAGLHDGGVNRYYAFDANQSGATIRVIVLDNSAGSLEQTAGGQTQWLRDRLADAAAKSLPVVVIAGQPLRATRDGAQVTQLLVDSGVAAVLTGSPEQNVNERRLIPEDVPDGTPQIPEYEGAILGYQQTLNNGVVWYDVSVDTTAVPAQVRVDAIPVIDTLAIKPLQGLSVPRSRTLQFEAIARRPVSSLATSPANPNFPGFDNYVAIPTPSCGTRPCVQPTYRFASSDPTIGDFVTPSGTGSRFPQLSSSGKTRPNAASGLFCGFNTGTTTVSVTVGLLSYSVPVTVGAGGFGPPCGTVARAGVGQVIVRKSVSNAAQPAGLNGPAAAPPVASASPVIPSIIPPPPVATPAPAPPIIAPVIAPLPGLVVRQILPVPPPPPPIQPIPPGGATAPSASTAPRREKAHKHASQSAFTIRPSGADAFTWFFPATVGAGILALLLCAGTVAAPRSRRRIEAAPIGRRTPIHVPRARRRY